MEDGSTWHQDGAQKKLEWYYEAPLVFIGRLKNGEDESKLGSDTPQLVESGETIGRSKP